VYLRTPKRYRVGKRPKRYLFNLRWLWLWIVTPLAVYAGSWLYERRDQIAPQVDAFINRTISSAGEMVSTAIAPTPTPLPDPTMTLARADSAWGRGAIEEAVQLYAEALPAVPNDVQVHYRYTLGLIMMGRREQALAAAEDAITANPFSADAWAVRALAQTRAGSPNAAIASGMQALALDPASARALAFMGEAYLDADQPGRAGEMVRRALSANPDSFEAYYVSGLINWQSRYDFNAAYADFQKALERAPNLPYIAIDMAWLEWNLQNYDNGLMLLEEVVDRNPTNLDGLFALGFYYYAVYGDPNRALDYLTRCVTASPNNISCLSYLGTVQAGTGDTRSAVETYARLIRAGTQNPAHYLAAGRVNLQVGDCRSALPLLRTGYALEQSAPSPNADRLAQFETFMRDCGSPVS
jgi:tetratricopeptide (TPR) repeat protein